MKVISTLCFLLVVSLVSGQADLPAANQKREPVARSTCRAVVSGQSADPLIIVDGKILDNKELNNIDPNTISSIEILKGAVSSAIYGEHGINGVIVIITKNFFPRIHVRDIISNEELKGAVITFKRGNSTVMEMTNDNGTITTDKLLPGKEYTATITMTGYKKLAMPYNTKLKEQTILLERDVKLCPEVIVISYEPIRCGMIYGSITTVSHCSMEAMPSSPENTTRNVSVINTYPNPVQKGEAVTVELKGESTDLLKMKIISLDGRLLLSQGGIKNNARLTIRTGGHWPAGMYVVGIFNQGGQLIQSSKLIVQ